jgi:hypothetical protein
MRARMVMMRLRKRMRRKNLCRMRRSDLGASDVDGYEGKDCDDVDVDEEAQTLQADDGSSQNVED